MTLSEGDRLVNKVNVIGKYSNLILGSTYDNNKSVGIITGIKFKNITFHYSYSTPQSINNALKLGGNEIKITYFLD
ncbi:MAG: type IX secretion system membrane protein PorP/SprF [Flavobacteriales bacterium]|mgnify:CR=1 FL=1|nr:type IX secretion system membrane protein PorP/SprF [Flavobacteriales bacterium]